MTPDLDAIAAELERLDAAATPGKVVCLPAPIYANGEEGYWEDRQGNWRFTREEDARLWTAVRTHLPALLAERRQMKAEIDRLQATGARLANAAYNLAQSPLLGGGSERTLLSQRTTAADGTTTVRATATTRDEDTDMTQKTSPPSRLALREKTDE